VNLLLSEESTCTVYCRGIISCVRLEHFHSQFNLHILGTPTCNTLKEVHVGLYIYVSFIDFLLILSRFNLMSVGVHTAIPKVTAFVFGFYIQGHTSCCVGGLSKLSPKCDLHM